MNKKQIEKLKKLGFEETTNKGQYHYKYMLYVYDYPEEKHSYRNSIQISQSFYPHNKDFNEEFMIIRMYEITEIIKKVYAIVNNKK